MEINVTNSYTEIYIGGGNFITEAYPTNFHRRYTRKILTASEKPEDFREVTAAEMERIETEDAGWRRPEQGFIDLWDAACSIGLDPLGKPLGVCGGFNEATGYFELNGITDIGHDEAIEILRLYDGVPKRYCGLGNHQRRPVRTLFPIRSNSSNSSHGVAYTDFSQTNVYGLKKILFLRFAGWQWSGFQVDGLNNSLTNASLEEVATEYSPLDVSGLHVWNGFYDARSLREFRMRNIHFDLTLAKSAYISLASLQYSVEWSSNGSNRITFTVHPDVFAKLTGDTTNAAAAALTPEELAAWTALPEQAAEKDIQFASA